MQEQVVDVQVSSNPRTKLAKDVTHDQEVNFKERFRGKEDTAKELQNHAAKKTKTLRTRGSMRLRMRKLPRSSVQCCER